MHIRSNLIAALVLGLTVSAQAGRWYAGVDLGYVEHEFTPTYTFTYDRAPKDFVDKADGMEIGISGGYSEPVCPYFSMACQTRLTFNESEWTLSTDDPAELQYEIPLTCSLTVVPTFTVTEKVLLFLETGFIGGSVSEKKSSAVHSSYDFSEWRTGCTIGAGIWLSIGDKTGVSVVYRRAEFDSFSYKSYMPDGTHWETVQDDPVTDSYSIGLTYSF